MFDIQVYSMSIPAVRDAARDHANAIIERYKQACVESDSFIRAISATTKTHEAFVTRHRQWAQILKEVCSVDYPIPEPLQRS